MTLNVGKTDKSIRLLLAVIILAAGAYFRSWWGLLAVVPLITGAISFCPLYGIFGISTCKIKKAVH
ncbi:MAG TPA: DUF2892 domain-containing protein [Ferruginibacter sp.]|nr:DUF2892 domain-containing protein [Ferruginibacter sp.]